MWINSKFDVIAEMHRLLLPSSKCIATSVALFSSPSPIEEKKKFVFTVLLRFRALRQARFLTYESVTF